MHCIKSDRIMLRTTFGYGQPCYWQHLGFSWKIFCSMSWLASIKWCTQLVLSWKDWLLCTNSVFYSIRFSEKKVSDVVSVELHMVFHNHVCIIRSTVCNACATLYIYVYTYMYCWRKKFTSVAKHVLFLRSQWVFKLIGLLYFMEHRFYVTPSIFLHL